MSLNRYAKRRDENEHGIVKELRQCGFQVKQQDCPDLALRRRSDGRIFLLEVDGITHRRKRSAQQLKFLEEWQIPRISTTEQALRVCGHS